MSPVALTDPAITLIRPDDIAALRAALKAEQAARRADRPAIIARAIELRELRWSYERIAAELNMAKITVRNWLVRAGRGDLLGRDHVTVVRGPERKPYPRPVSRHLPTIIAMREQRATLEAIGQALGITRERVRQILQKANRPDLIGNGVAIRKPRPPGPRAECICEVCGSTFAVLPCHAKRRRFCSKRCASRYTQTLPGVRAAHSERMRRLHQQPEFIEKLVASVRSPEARAKKSASAKARWARIRAAKAA